MACQTLLALVLLLTVVSRFCTAGNKSLEPGKWKQILYIKSYLTKLSTKWTLCATVIGFTGLLVVVKFRRTEGCKGNRMHPKSGQIPKAPLFGLTAP